MVFVREDIPAKELSSEEKPIEAFFFELNLHKKKWLVCCSYNPHKSNISSHLNDLGKSIDLYSAHYDNIILLGDFNVSIDDPHMDFFCEAYRLKSIIKDATCFKNLENPSCIDVILTNSPYSFQNSCVIETGLSDFHKMTVSVMKTTFQKLKPKIVQYRDYTKFSNDEFRKKLVENLSLQNIPTDGNGLEKFLQICISTLDQFAPRKKNTYVVIICLFSIKHYPVHTKKRTQLRNRFLKKRSYENKKLYTEQRNFCVSLLRKTKKKRYANLNHKDIADNKQFWKTMKPLLSDKSKSNEKITLVEANEIISEDKDNAELLHSFFANAVKNLKIPEFSNSDPQAENVSHPIFKAILKYKNHPSIIAIKNARNGPSFYFCRVNVNDVRKEINRLKTRKAIQVTDIPVKILKENADLFSAYICDFLNETIRSGKFPSILKNGDITAVFKKGYKGSKENYRPVSILPIISKLFEKMIGKQRTHFMDPLLSNISLGFEEVLGHKIVYWQCWKNGNHLWINGKLSVYYQLTSQKRLIVYHMI